MADRLILIDGHALVFRAFHALPELTSPRGEVVNAVYGFISMLLKVCQQLAPRYVVATFDTSSKTFRRAAFEAYKGTRPPQPAGLGAQFGHVYNLLEALAIPIFRLEGYEADDLLGTLSCQAADQGLDVVILTGDTDALQLVKPRVQVLTSRRGFSDTVLYDEGAVRERYGLEPSQLADFKALRGDTSDNIPGVPGVGDKTATRLLAQFGSVERLYDHLAELPAKQRDLLEPYRDQVRLAKQLTTIVCDLELQLDLPAAELRGFDTARVRDLLHEFGFRSLLDRLPQVLAPGRPAVRTVGQNGDSSQLGMFESAPAAARATAADAASEGPAVSDGGTVQSSTDAAALAEAIERAGACAIVIQGSIRDPMRASLVGLAFAADSVPPSYLPLGHQDGGNLASPADAAGGLAGVLAAPAIGKYGHDVKRQMVLLGRQGLSLDGLRFDTMIAAYLLESSQRQTELRDLAWGHLQEELPPLSTLVGSGRGAITLAEVPVEKVSELARREVAVVCRLVPILERELEECGLRSLFDQVELPLVPVLADMEADGVAIDVPYLQGLSRELHLRLTELEREIFGHVGHQFNVNSTKQLADVLYGELQLPRSRKTATGQGSTGADVLESLRAVHPIVDLILEHRQLQKLKSTYVDALPLLVNPSTGRVHTYFNQTVAATGRLSSSEPNLQNIPIRTELGRRVRRAFVPGASGCQLLSADYSQIELRILAHETQDPRLLEAFREGQDIHAATAAEVMGVPPEQVTADMRRFAKVVNFGVLYGMSEFGLASRTELPQADAAAFIQRYFERFGTVKEYQERIIRQVEQLGYAETLMKRRRYIPEIKSSLYAARQGAIRAAINHPIQGAASDIMKLAMIRVHDYLRQQGLKTRMILQVHDELVFESPVDELQPFASQLRQIMMGAMELSVPLNVELKAGPNWEEMAPLAHA